MRNDHKRNWKATLAGKVALNAEAEQTTFSLSHEYRETMRGVADMIGWLVSAT